METVMSSQSNIYWTEATVAPDGSLILAKPSDLPLKPGEKVAVILSPLPKASLDAPYPLQGTVVHYEDPFGPATALEDWEVM